MKKKMMKALRDLNAYIDDDRQKLCDELHEVKLSHKRMERLLRLACSYIKDYDSYQWYQRELLLQKIILELSYPYYRVNYKQKGGKNA